MDLHQEQLLLPKKINITIFLLGFCCVCFDRCGPFSDWDRIIKLGIEFVGSCCLLDYSEHNN